MPIDVAETYNSLKKKNLLGMDIHYQNSTGIVNDITLKLISFLKPYKKFDAMRNMCVCNKKLCQERITHSFVDRI